MIIFNKFLHIIDKRKILEFNNYFIQDLVYGNTCKEAILLRMEKKNERQEKRHMAFQKSLFPETIEKPGELLYKIIATIL